VTNGRRALGAHGEQLAARWYESRGYTVVARNWRSRTGEIDLVMSRGTLVVICEVKTRSSTAYGTPAEAVGRTKQQRLRRLAIEWIGESGWPPSPIRFDVACVMRGVVDVIESAF
jgi:putative endonuclease